VSDTTKPTALDADALAMARDHMYAIDQLAQLDADQRVQLIARGTSIGQLQRNELAVANTWALVAIADELQRIRKVLERQAEP
jgi:hypothetical protein